MQADFKRDVNHSYLILEGPDEVDTSGYHTRMLLCNRFISLLPCKIQSMDGKSLFYYEITSHQSFFDRYERMKLGWEEMQSFFRGIVQGVQELGSYLLNADDLVLDPRFIYLEADLEKIRFCYLPGYRQDIGRQFLELTEYLLPKINHRDSQAVTLGYGMYRLAMEEEFQVDKMKEELYREYEKKAESIFPEEKPLEYEEDLSEPDWDKDIEQKEDGKEENSPLFLRDEGLKGDEKRVQGILIGLSAVGIFGALFLLFRIGRMDLAAVLGGFASLMGAGAFVFWIAARKKGKADERNIIEREKESLMFEKKKEEENRLADEKKCGTGRYCREKEANEPEKSSYESFLTTLLTENTVCGGSSLISKEEGRFPPILLEQDLVIIGKLDTVADVILPYPTVSRVHSKIRRIRGEYYLMDLNSRNGTFVNGRMLQAEEEYQMQDQDEVRFADLTYIFLK